MGGRKWLTQGHPAGQWHSWEWTWALLSPNPELQATLRVLYVPGVLRRQHQSQCSYLDPETSGSYLGVSMGAELFETLAPLAGAEPLKSGLELFVNLAPLSAKSVCFQNTLVAVLMLLSVGTGDNITR